MEEDRINEAKESLLKEADNYKEFRTSMNKRFIETNELPYYSNYSAVSKFKSIRRAIRRGHVDLISGVIYPNKPFNNRKNTPGRKFQRLKEQIYGQYYKRTV